MKIFILFSLVMICTRAFPAESLSFQGIELVVKEGAFKMGFEAHSDWLEGATKSGVVGAEQYLLVLKNVNVNAFGYCYGKGRWMVVKFNSNDRVFIYASRNLSQDNLVSLILTLGPNAKVDKVEGIMSDTGVIFISKAFKVLAPALGPE